MTKKSLTSGLSADHKEVVRLFIKHPIKSISIIISILSAGFWVGEFYAKVNNNESINNKMLDLQKDIEKAREDEQIKCKELFNEYKELVILLTPELKKDEKK